MYRISTPCSDYYFFFFAIPLPSRIDRSRIHQRAQGMGYNQQLAPWP